MDYYNRIYRLAHFSDKRQRKRATFYLQEKTRPDFSDDVAETEQAMFEAVDEMSYPEVLKNVKEEDLYWLTEDEDGYPDMALAEKLGAETALCVHVQMGDGAAFSITRKLLGGKTETIFEPSFFDDYELDRPIVVFMELLEEKLDLGGQKFMLWLEEYLEQGGMLPQT